MKKLFLAAEAGNPESWKKLEEFIGGFKGKRIAYVPTASNGERKYGTWRKESDTWKKVNKTGAIVKAVELDEYKDSSVLKEFKNIDIVWFAGGMPGYLLYWIRRTELDKELPKLLNKGVIYVGSSAGSMIASRTQYLSEVYIGESEIGASIFPGLGFVDFEIYPHYEDALLPKIKKVWKKKWGKLCLLKNSEAITIVGNKIDILGERRMLK
jgi:dipeptidase E